MAIKATRPPETPKITKQVNWLSREIVTGPNMTMVTSQSEFREVLKVLGIPLNRSYCEIDALACVHNFQNAKGGIACVVGVRLDALKKFTIEEQHAVIVHEAVHVWQNHRARITGHMNVGSPSGLEMEFEAYSIQSLSEILMFAYTAAVKAQAEKKNNKKKANNVKPT